VFNKITSASLVVVVACIAVGSTTSGASALTVELARKCSALMSKAYPPREAGNPAAGSGKGNGKEAQAYYQKCLANNGKADDNTGAQGNNAPQGNDSGTKPK